MPAFRFLIAILLAAASLQVHAADDSLYNELGGSAGIRRVVADLVPALQADARINATFDGVDMERLAAKLEEQFCEVSGGPCKYSGKDMTTIHEDLKVSRAQFNALVEDLQAAMRRNDVPSRTQNRLLARLAPMHREVVTK
ncbi:group I truncated hemoglobin [Noviherbaspirillum suwonense]|jgi:hemoglobin|uniref:Group 1 truncated hemoglobin n=1 Tax=Noviherbaspirillum suwonense TaxID=1224511 RepID=A0ABY1PZQ7_9BURK|nr:group 1 truncated hemoglobin [Noviherbaspirillum suwonense]SMP51455.1 hemoglobin [Noviherbaspirillum suwonense]